jgi:Circadian oscillating protein COP23
MQSHPVNLIKIFFLSNLCMASAFMAIPQSPVRADRSYSFACNSVGNFRKTIPVTMILFSNGTSLKLIRWESEFITNPEQKCKEVSKKFNILLRDGNLQVLKFTTDKITRRTIICGLSRQNKDRPCDANNKLFELSKMSQDPKKVLNGLVHNMVTIDNDGGIFQNSDDEDTQIIDFEASIERQSANR